MGSILWLVYYIEIIKNNIYIDQYHTNIHTQEKIFNLKDELQDNCDGNNSICNRYETTETETAKIKFFHEMTLIFTGCRLDIDCSHQREALLISQWAEH